MINFLILRLRNAAIAADQRGDHNLAELLTEAINELEKKETKPVKNKKFDAMKHQTLLGYNRLGDAVFGTDQEALAAYEKERKDAGKQKA